MDIASVRREVEKWSLDDRVKLVEALWDDIVEIDPEFGLDPEQLTELHPRIDAADANPAEFETWEEVKQRILGTK